MVDTHKTSNWKIPFIIGILLTIGIGSGITYRIFNPSVDTNTLRIARLLNTDPRKLQEVEQLRKQAQEAARNKTEFPEADWRKLVGIFHDPNENIRLQAIRIMTYLGNTKRRDTILTMVRPLLNESPMVQVSTLSLLQRYNDPSWRYEAEKRVNSKDEYLREIASGLLGRNTTQ